MTLFLNIHSSAVHHEPIDLGHPDRTPTPYGGRLTWRLPGDSILVVHLKDKNKIRHKKRWSQSMYMYYLLGYKGIAKDWETELPVPQGDKDKKQHFIPNIYTLGDLFESLPPRIAKEVRMRMDSNLSVETVRYFIISSSAYYNLDLN